ncbi:concanavalin A-like lectin/glucanase [Eremomyces bilateralis CBS 781.70]|uniref:Concanavalin A-like lectin/glucanase n=1 Tax=Eremomyces bilateralis CBS 781.70 TaxID=1392243 RepID=A0A6G1FZX1_9PEZI|nr:concanavalin A-like lectin/glucanase [Eremomyces bilateralis CBS 781.70]KAF1811333.1 concanavalin A-like lectin/glucanase [Eremomyces bilateralis CBS 781.70]
MSTSGSGSRAPSIHTPSSNPFSTPLRSSRVPSEDERRVSYFPSTAIQGHAPRQRKFKSARFTGEYEKPWLDEPNPRRKWERLILWGSVVIGFAIGGFICYMAYASVSNFEYCLVMDDNFESINSDHWGYEIQRGGFGTGGFDWTTDDPKNAYTDSEGLHIVPTLTIETTNIDLGQLTDNYVLNLTTDGTCTENGIDECSIRSNITSGDIINPVRSARLTTKGKKSIKYGRVEVIAKMPKGSWLWPAIWMMPENDVYGIWPRSGEIDIAESRGNHGDDYPDGRDSVISALHWGPLPEVDGFWKTSGKHNVRRTDYSEQFHTFGLEWNENYLFTYIDSRLLQTFFIKFNHGPKSMWDRGNFGETIVNHSALFDPWSQTDRANTPFDTPFYLILNVAVGGTNGYWKDGVGNKPWGDASIDAPRQFWESQGQWYPTWGEGAKRGLTVKSVKMWSEGACGS